MNDDDTDDDGYQQQQHDGGMQRKVKVARRRMMRRIFFLCVRLSKDGDFLSCFVVCVCVRKIPLLFYVCFATTDRLILLNIQYILSKIYYE